MALKLVPPKPWRFANCCSTLAISSPVSRIRAKTFGSSSICFHRMLTPSQTISHLHKRATKLLLQSWINQRQVSCRIKPLLHRDWIDRHHHFQRRGYICIKNMASAGCSIRVSNYHVRMDYGLALIERDITAHPNHFVLTVEGNLLVHFALGIEPPQRCSIQCSDTGEMSTRNLILLRKLQQSGKRLVSLIEDDRILLRRFSWVQQLNLHLGSFTPWNGFRRRDEFPCRLLRIPNYACDPNQHQNTKSPRHRFLRQMTCRKWNAGRLPMHQKVR